MKRIYTTAITVFIALLLASAAHAQVTLNSVRIGAKDTVGLAKFYQTAFGMTIRHPADQRRSRGAQSPKQPEKAGGRGAVVIWRRPDEKH